MNWPAFVERHSKMSPLPSTGTIVTCCLSRIKRRLFGQIVAAAVRATEGTDIPVTVKFRIGIDDAHHTHLDAGRIAAEEGAGAVALHARTAAQRYSGTAD